METLNQEIEDHHLDRARDRSHFEQARAAVDRQIQQLEFSSPAERIRSIWLDQLRSERLDSDSPRRRRFGSDDTSMSQPGTGRDGRGRLKRRKLDSDDLREGMRGFNYGQYGQVVPGALKMEIASCDGGTYDPDGDSSFPENILRNDQSVYCTKSDRCNLVLRHRGEAPFCLKKIVIKAPRTGFDAPYVFSSFLVYIFTWL